MKEKSLQHFTACTCSIVMLLMSFIVQAQSEENSIGPPPIEQQLVREGVLAKKLAYVLAIGAAADEAQAESLLAEVGISPKNGWIADYPVTPVIAGELRQAVEEAADAGKLTMNPDAALQAFEELLAATGLPVAPVAQSGDGVAGENPAEMADEYLQAELVRNYYSSEGPPVVTYYSPPREYTYLYIWVPYPFWTTGYLFPGFFILHDFHRTIYVHSRPYFVTNHFRDRKTHQVYRIHPMGRLGETSHSSYGYRNHHPWSNRSGNINGPEGQAFSRSWRRPSLTARPVSQRNSISNKPARVSSQAGQRQVPSTISAGSSAAAGLSTGQHINKSSASRHSWSNRHSGAAGNRQFHRGQSSDRQKQSSRSFNRSSRHGGFSRGGHGRR